jgi:hypothetical protein
VNKYVQATRIYMVLYTLELITPEMIEQLGELYPSVSDRFGEPLRRAISVGTRSAQWPHTYKWGDNADVAFSIAFDEALQYLLKAERLQNPARFDELASRAFGTDMPSLANANVMSYRHFFATGNL